MKNGCTNIELLINKVNIDKSSSNTAVLNEINKYLDINDKIIIRQCKYFNNIVEQDHCFIKKITRTTLGFKALYLVAAALDGIELHHMIKKSQMASLSKQTIFEQFYSLTA